jgi:hypothetical protein
MEPITEDVITHGFELYYSRALSYKFRETAFYSFSTSDSTSDDCIFYWITSICLLLSIPSLSFGGLLSLKSLFR